MPCSIRHTHAYRSVWQSDMQTPRFYSPLEFHSFFSPTGKVFNCTYIIIFLHFQTVNTEKGNSVKYEAIDFSHLYLKVITK